MNVGHRQRGPAARLARALPRLKLSLCYGEGQQPIAHGFGGAIALVDEVGVPTPVQRAVLLERHVNHDVGGRERAPGRGTHHGVDRAPRDAEQRLAHAFGVGEIAHIDGNHAIRAHRLHDVRGDVVHRAAVDQHLAVHHGWRKDQRQRHRGAHGVGQRSPPHHDLLRRQQIHGHRAKRCRQIVEAFKLEIRRRDAAEHQFDVLAIVQRGRRHDAAFEAELQAGRIGPRVGLPPDVLVGKRRRPEQLIPVHVGDERLQLRRIHAAGEGAPDQSAHAGPRRQIDRDSVLLEPANDADVRDAAGASAAERHTDRWSSCLHRDTLRRGTSGAGRRRTLRWAVKGCRARDTHHRHENGRQAPHPLDLQSHTLALSEVFRPTCGHA